jgi:Protein of unknown function (DUF3616)
MTEAMMAETVHDPHTAHEAPPAEDAVRIRLYQGACDASAAARLGDSSLFVAASDEDYILRLYDASAPGPPVDRVDVIAHLAPEDDTKEPDIEGSAVVGDRVYWITSHGRDKNAIVQESRQRFFATALIGSGSSPRLAPVGRACTRLLHDLTRASDLARFDLDEASRLAPEAEGGLNIEGLAPAAEGHLLVGFRNPIREGRALVARLHNPADLVDDRDGADTIAARFTLAGHLDLGGRGIRALEHVPALGGYLLLAGAFDDSGDFALFRWSGRLDDEATRIETDALAELNPEELIATPGAGLITIDLFSDDGDRLMGEKKCKKKAEADRAFRVGRFTLAVP